VGSGSARRLKRVVALAAAAALATAGLLVASPAVADDSVITVLPTDIGAVNVSPDSTAWDRNPGANQSAYADAAFSPADLPASGDAPWKLDMENKPLGLLEVTDSGLALGANAAALTKAKVQYYVGSGGYPSLDAQSPTLADLFDEPIGWTQTLVSGAVDYGVTMQIQLQKKVSDGEWARVTLVSVWAPGTGARDLRAGDWFANTDIHADGFLTGAKVNKRQSGPGVAASVILANFGDFEVVSFGPNLGRDGLDYVYRVQDLAILGATFRFGLPPTLHVDPYFVSGALYQGIGVDLRATGVSDATEVRVTVHRSLGGDVVKTSRPDGSVLATVNAGNAVTAPIVIQAGTYDEAGSGSWVPAVAGGAAPIWTPETLPTGVTVELLRGDEVIVEQTVASIGTTLATLADVMPAAPRFTTPTAAFRNAENYRGITVDIRVDDVRDAEQILVQVDRAGAQPVVKKSKRTAASALNTGGPVSITAPIVIQPGTYDEAASSSWFKPVAVWTPTSVPTSVTVTIKRTYGPDLVTTLAITGSSAGILPTTTPTAPIVVEIPTDTPTYEVEVPTGAEDVKLNLGTPAATGGGAEISVPVEVVVTTQVGANVTIAANTKVTSADPAWDGVVQLPKVRTDVVVPAASGQATTVGVAIELGSPTTRLDFDTPVKLVLADQAGKRAGYVQGGAFHAIDTACPITAPAGLTTDECWLDDGADLVIWTTHFTTFVSYDSVAVPAPGGGGSGGGGGGATGGSTTTGGSGTSGGSAAVPVPVATATPKPVPAPATSAPRPTSTPDVPEEEAEPAAAVPQEGGGFDPFWLVVIVVAVAVLGAGVATIVTVRRRARG